jgi:hypothetical protein
VRSLSDAYGAAMLVKLRGLGRDFGIKLGDTCGASGIKVGTESSICVQVVSILTISPLGSTV